MNRSRARSQHACRSSSYPSFLVLKHYSYSFRITACTTLPKQIHDYPWFVRELTRILRPGGLLILIEFDLCPIADGQFAPTPTRSGIPGWCKLQEETKRCLKMRGVDSSVPERMAEFVDNTGWYESVRQQQADIPIGFWPKGTFALCSTYHAIIALTPSFFVNF